MVFNGKPGRGGGDVVAGVEKFLAVDQHEWSQFDGPMMEKNQVIISLRQSVTGKDHGMSPAIGRPMVIRRWLADGEDKRFARFQCETAVTRLVGSGNASFVESISRQVPVDDLRLITRTSFNLCAAAAPTDGVRSLI